MKSDLNGTVSLVTGSANGIGQAIADRLAANGSRVVYSDLRLEEAQSAAEGQPDALAYALDVTDTPRLREVIAEVAEKCGRLDVLVNNAGIGVPPDRRETFDNFSSDIWQRVIKVDLDAVFEASKAAAQIMRAQESGGRIINIASIAGLVPLQLQCAYAAAKAGVVNLTKAMAVELGGHGVLINGIAPGSILTEGTRQLFYREDGTFHGRAQEMLDHVPLGRPGTVDEIAIAAQFLADPENTYTNGHILTVDGGWTAGYHRDF